MATNINTNTNANAIANANVAPPAPAPEPEVYDTYIDCSRRVRVSLCLIFISTFTIAYLITGSIIVYTNSPSLYSVDVSSVSIDFHSTQNTSASLDATAGLLVSFNKPRLVVSIPKVATYALNIRLDRDFSLSSVGTPFQITDSEEAIQLSFKPQQIWLEQPEMEHLKYMLADDQDEWIQLTGDYKMETRLARYMPYPRSHWHLKFHCDLVIRRAGVPLTLVTYKRCNFL